ncbi:uncharacterized protein LOC123506556 [Portunus trituberculatus]|uniref:uncharacterized protein LOC123506556 n=1 Tax=Portunus trituberculatus TaxID=210409 RepID=UPI001E1CBC84|nr:uncharacterized protein LOC123506556 [Portunus trituberculatus]
MVQRSSSTSLQPIATYPFIPHLVYAWLASFKYYFYKRHKEDKSTNPSLTQAIVKFPRRWRLTIEACIDNLHVIDNRNTIAGYYDCCEGNLTGICCACDRKSAPCHRYHHQHHHHHHCYMPIMLSVARVIGRALLGTTTITTTTICHQKSPL